MIRRPPRSTLFPYNDALPISPGALARQFALASRLVAALRGDSAALEQVRALRKEDRKSTRLNSSHVRISYAVFCLKKKKFYKRALRNRRTSPPRYRVRHLARR